MERHGDGFVTSLSESGLLVGLASDRRRLRARLMLTLPHGEGGSFEVPGVVVRSHEWGFAIRFDSLDTAQLLKLRALWEGLAKEAIASTREDQTPPTAKPDSMH